MKSGDDKILEAVVEQVINDERNEAGFSHWDDYCAQKKSSDEIAQDPMLEQTTEDRAVLEALFSPPTSNDIDSLVDLAAEALAQPEQLERPVSQFKPKEPSKRSITTYLIPMAAAAGFLICVGLVYMLLQPTDPAVNPYTLTFKGGQDTFRSESKTEHEVPTLLPTNEIEILLRPNARTTQENNISLYYLQNGELRKWSAAYEPSASGVFKLFGSPKDLGLSGQGEYNLYFVIGSKQALQKNQDEIESALRQGDRSSPSPSIQFFEQKIRIVDEL